MASPLLRLLPSYLGAGLLITCAREPESAPTQESRSARYARDETTTPTPRAVHRRPAGARAVEVSSPSNTAEATNEPGRPAAAPPETVDADLLEAAALRPSDWSTFGTRAQAIRCQPALGEAALFFTPSWYAYDDQSNPEPVVTFARAE